MKIFKKIEPFMSSKKGMMLITFLGLYLLSAGISLAVFTYLKNDPSVSLVSGDLADARSKLNLDLPRTEECPLNGEKFTTIEKNIWQSRRPLAAMIENHVDSRPQSGLSRADVVYEAVAEGGITRFLGIFYCAGAASDVHLAPIRSARVYFVNEAAEYGDNPIFLHQGGANNFCNNCPGGVKPRGTVDPRVDAYALLDKLGWRNGTHGNDFDGGFNIGLPVVVRDQYRLSSEPAAWEHSVVASLDEAYKEAEKRGFTNKSNGVAWDKNFEKWSFVDGAPASSPKASKISFNFWDNKGDYDVAWNYISSKNAYERDNGGRPHIDWEFDKPVLTANNVVVMFADEESSVDKEFHQYYEVIGSGEALIFQNGNVIEGKWKKDSVTGRTIFSDNSGKEISFVRGPIWIEIVPTGNKISY